MGKGGDGSQVRARRGLKRQACAAGAGRDSDGVKCGWQGARGTAREAGLWVGAFPPPRAALAASPHDLLLPGTRVLRASGDWGCLRHSHVPSALQLRQPFGLFHTARLARAALLSLLCHDRTSAMLDQPQRFTPQTTPAGPPP